MPSDSPDRDHVAGEHSPSNVLLVDDDDSLRKAVARRLRRRGWVVREAATLVQAVEVLSEWRADVVITDLRLEGASGLELLEALPGLRPSAAAILMSGDPRDDERDRAFVLGAVRVLTKPVPLALLDEALQQALSMADATTPDRNDSR